MEYRHVKVEHEDKLPVITLDRPEVLNELHLPAHHEQQPVPQWQAR